MLGEDFKQFDQVASQQNVTKEEIEMAKGFQLPTGCRLSENKSI